MEDETKKDVEGLIVGVVGVGVGTIVQNIITATAPGKVGTFMKCVTLLGGLAVGTLLTDETCNHVQQKMTDIRTKVELSVEKARNKQLNMEQ